MILGIYGAGGLGREILILATQINEVYHHWDKIVFVDDQVGVEFVEETEVYKFLDFAAKFSHEDTQISIALGEPYYREKLATRVLMQGYELATLVHPSVYIHKSTQLGSGCIICSGSFISCNSKICKNVLIQPHVNVGHDCVIGDHSVLSGFVNLGGHCTILERTYIALSVCIRDQVNIGFDTIIGMGSVVTKDIPDQVIALGNPARVMRRNEDHKVF